MSAAEYASDPAIDDEARTLAILGGRPAFETPLHVGRPNIADKEAVLARIGAIMDRRWLTNNGPTVQAFEARVAQYVGVKHCVAEANNTLGLFIAMRALGIKGEVILPAFTFVATANVVEWLGLTPRFADIDPATGCIDPADVERLITPQTGAIVGVHLWGNVCDTARLDAIAAQHDVPLLFDSAQAFGVSLGGRKVGSFGIAEVFSFHSTKIVNSFEGGAVVTDDDRLANTLSALRNFGFAGSDRIMMTGINAKMTEPCAAMGLESLSALDRFVDWNKTVFARYREVLDGIPGIHLQDHPEGSNFHYAVLDVDQKAFGVDRDTLLHVLHGERVLARRYYFPGCHRLIPYRMAGAGRTLPATDRAAAGVLQLPTGMSITLADVARIGEIIRQCHAAAPQVRAHLAAGRSATFPYHTVEFYNEALAREGVQLSRETLSPA
ncbi:MAG: DegT/DnrJ/EryC1/StrS family aminotransferase [Pseudomonadota bacterium]